MRGAVPEAPAKKKTTTVTVKTEEGEDVKKQVIAAPKKAGMTQQEFDKANGLIYADTVAVLDIEMLKLLVDVAEGDGQQAWIALLQHFEKNTQSAKREAAFDLINLKQKSKETMSDYVTRSKEANRKIQLEGDS